MRLVFIGGGNMASAMIGGLRRHGAGAPADDILVIEPDPARRALLTQDLAVDTAARPDERLRQADLCVLAVKPADVAGVCAGLRELGGTPLVLSIAAGIPSEAIARWSGCPAVVRAMPNTPALIGQGITGLYARPGVAAQQRADAGRALAGIGQVVWLDDEDMLDTVTAISGSGPAYVFYFIEALQAAAGRMGMDEAQARQFAVQTFVGAAQLAAQSPESLALLRERVTSKGGTTAAGLARLEAAQVAASIGAAADAARERSREMARQYGAA